MHKSHKTFEKLLTKVEKPTRYLGNELNVVIKEWTPDRLKVALAFPDTYEIGMSHMGTRILYKLLNDKDNCLAERVYMPWIDMRNMLREHNVPLLALESWQPLRKI
jgi:GH24 family phage-related lysozyme (muramidase)